MLVIRIVFMFLALWGMPMGSFAGDQSQPYVGISMPTKSAARWIADGKSMADQFEEAGYKTDLQYAEDDIPNQLAQIENMLVKGVDVLVIAAIDGQTLYSALESASALGVKVVAYDRLIRGSEHVDYYATFDNFQVGVLQAESLLRGLHNRGEPPFNIEVFGGSPDDSNAYFFYDGAMSVLQPLIEQGQLVVVSGQQGMDVVGTLRWDGALAQARMDNLISAHYTGKTIHGVLSPYDGLSIGIISSLKGVGYGIADMPLPVVTGQDAELSSVKSIVNGEQYSTIFKDTRELAGVAVGMVNALINDGKPKINDTTTYHNGKKVVPSFLLNPVLVNGDNLKPILIDSGYYKSQEIRLP